VIDWLRMLVPMGVALAVLAPEGVAKLVESSGVKAAEAK
jgi:hypothetical protein